MEIGDGLDGRQGALEENENYPWVHGEAVAQELRTAELLAVCTWYLLSRALAWLTMARCIEQDV